MAKRKTKMKETLSKIHDIYENNSYINMELKNKAINVLNSLSNLPDCIGVGLYPRGYQFKWYRSKNEIILVILTTFFIRFIVISDRSFLRMIDLSWRDAYIISDIVHDFYSNPSKYFYRIFHKYCFREVK